MKAGWTTKRLGEVILKSETTDPSRRPETRFTYIDVSSVSSATLEIEETQRVVGRDAPSRARKLIRKGDVLFATIRPTLRRIAVVPESLDGEVCSTGYFVLRASAEVLPRFLYYFLQTECFMSSMEALQKGASYPAVTDGDVRDQVIPLPPLPEQRRIVDLLDRAFQGLAVAAANAEKNLENARELFESHLSDVFAQRGEGWVETTLSACTGGVFTGPFGSLLHKKDYVENGIPLVNPAHITEEGIEADITKTVSPATASRLASYVMRRDDVVIGRRGEMGRCAVVTEAQDGWLCGTGSFFIRPSSQCDSRFLVRLLRSRPVRARLDALAGGAVMPNLSNTALAGLPIDLPPMLQQRRIVELLDALALEVHRLRRVNEQKQASLAALKKSLLQQAFAGSL